MRKPVRHEESALIGPVTFEGQTHDATRPLNHRDGTSTWTGWRLLGNTVQQCMYEYVKANNSES